RIATTSSYVRDGMLHRYTSKPFAALVAARSLAAALPRGLDRSLLLQRLETVPDNSHDPLAALRRLDARRLRPVARTLVRLLTNRDPERFHSLYVALPERIRRIVTFASCVRPDDTLILYRLVGLVTRPVIRVLFRPQLRGLEHLPRDGGFVLSANHLSGFDAWAVSYAIYPRQPRNMAKNQLFARPLLGPVIRSLGAFPAHADEAVA